MEDIPNKIQNTLGIVADVNCLTVDGKDYIEISVSQSSFPVNYKGEYHYRSGSTKQQLRGAALTDFLTSKTGSRWEDVIVPGVTAEDLDKESFDIFRREALRNKRMTKADLNMSNGELLDSLKLTVDGKLKRAAILLFHRNPEKWVSGCYTKIGIYLKYLKAPIEYVFMTRVETYPYPKDAVREALYNALIHSRWSSGVPIQIRIEDDAMYISNDCVFPSGWTKETLMQRHRSRPYNPAIADVFFRAGYVESWGRGIQKMCESCENYGTALPEYTVHEEDIMVKLTALPISQNAGSNIPKHQGDVLGDVLENKIIAELRKNSRINQKDLADKIQTSIPSIQRAMSRLREKGRIERKGGKRYGYWEIIEEEKKHE